MPLAPITTWRIHLGAHKTATTHVQETLALMRPELVARGVDFIPNHLLRRGGIAVALGRKRLWNRLPPLRGPMVRRILARAPRPAPGGPATLVFSEEKLLGGSQHVFCRADLPPGAADRPRCSPPSAPGGGDAASCRSAASTPSCPRPTSRS